MKFCEILQVVHVYKKEMLLREHAVQPVIEHGIQFVEFVDK